MILIRGRVPSLLAWGLLVGGVALLITLPYPLLRDDLVARALPGALLFVLAGLVFGLSHPHGLEWAGAAVMGWLPAMAGIAALVGGTSPDAATALALVLLPGLLAAVGARVGAGIARWRAGTP
ncbi:MAG: hypothetical protein GWM90_06515 [Gemmatimonadetes bacterium]|nr:hypothetical protein [Gemmatimonadota bacterium]NIQ53445.1 hypothetical protein [Gemmatimonadota bacterium]NIU73589.1 hypothetical protein [Gammaproteobacteria bacterium]NIX43774.1 hypothetical protein [Gemmatimonadota bacterium]NIY07977.1 hypothetical protein [Gemmatimonadota bacterium]